MLHDSVVVPDPITFVGDTVHEVLLVARLTVPAKPFWPTAEIVDIPWALTLTVTLAGLAVIVKS